MFLGINTHTEEAPGLWVTGGPESLHYGVPRIYTIFKGLPSGWTWPVTATLSAIVTRIDWLQLWNVKTQGLASANG